MCGTIGLIIIPISIVLIIIGISGLKKGVVLTDGLKMLPRDERPILFWIHIVIYIGIGVAGILLGLNPEWLIAIQVGYP